MSVLTKEKQHRNCASKPILLLLRVMQLRQQSRCSRLVHTKMSITLDRARRCAHSTLIAHSQCSVGLSQFVTGASAAVTEGRATESAAECLEDLHCKRSCSIPPPHISDCAGTVAMCECGHMVSLLSDVLVGRGYRIECFWCGSLLVSIG